MKSLFIGNIDNPVKEVIKYFDKQVGRKSNDIYKKNKLDYKKLFFCKKYDNVFYFSMGFDNYIDDLSNFLRIVDNSNDVKKYIYIVRGNKFNVDYDIEKIQIINEIFAGYAKQRDKSIIFLNTACLYGKNFIDGQIKNINDKKKYINKKGNYVHIEDFSRFLYLLGIHKVDELYIELKSDVSVNIYQLLSKKSLKGINIETNNLFDYKFKHSIVNDVNNGLNIKNIIKNNVTYKKEWPIIKILEIIIMFLIAEILINIFNTGFNLQYIDFRLIFMIIIAIYYDFKYSLFATLLVIIAFIFNSIETSYDLSILFTNTDNWLSIIIYLIMTVVIRNKINTYENFNKTANERIRLLQEQNKNKERNLKKYEIKIKELNKEIITHNNSFFKVATLISNYNFSNKEDIYEVFVDNLNIENIIIYDFINKDSYTPLEFEHGKLLIEDIVKLVTTTDIWVNKELNKNLPLYIVPILRNNEINYYVTIWEYDLSMLNSEYENKLVSLSRIISFVKDRDKS